MLNTYKYKEPINVMGKTELAPIIDQKNFLEYLLNPDREEELCYLDPKGYLEGEPKEFTDRVYYLCLRGLREGLLDLLEINRFSDLSKIAYVEEYAEKKYDPVKIKMVKTGKEIDSIEERIKRRLIEDELVKKYLAWNNSQELFESNCRDIASGVSTHFAHLIREKKLKLRGII